MNTSRANKPQWQRYATHDLQPNQTPKERRVQVVVKSKAWLTRGEKILYSLFGIILILCSYYLVSFSSATDTLNRDIQALQEEIELKQIQNESLTYKINELSRPERIKAIAEKYGLKVQNTKVKSAHFISEKNR